MEGAGVTRGERAREGAGAGAHLLDVIVEYLLLLPQPLTSLRLGIRRRVRPGGSGVHACRRRRRLRAPPLWQVMPSA